MICEWTTNRIAVEIWLALELLLRLKACLLRDHAILIRIEACLLRQKEACLLRLHTILGILLLQSLLLVELTQALSWWCL